MARSFNGTLDVVNCGTVPNLNGATKATIAGWIYRASTSTTCGFGGAGGSTTGGDRFSTIWYSDGNIYTACGATTSLAYGFCALSGAGWHHFAAVFNGSGAGSSTRLLVYIDGVLKTLSFPGPIPTTIGSVSPFKFGQDSSDRFCGGVNAEGACWPGSALTAGEIAALASGERPHKIRPASLAGYWPLDGLQSLEPDFSGNRNNGTLTGTAKADGPPTTLFTPKSGGMLIQPAGVVATPSYLSLLGVG